MRALPTHASATYTWLTHDVGTGVQGSHDQEVMANKILMIPYLTSGIVAPLMGGVIDRIGHRYAPAAAPHPPPRPAPARASRHAPSPPSLAARFCA